MGCTGKPPERRPRRRNRSVAGRQRCQSPRSTTNRRNSARNAPGPVETTPRPGYRARHPPASRCEGRRATGSTHRTQTLARRQAAPVPKARTASERASRTRPLTPVKLLRRGCGSRDKSWHAAMAAMAAMADCRIGVYQGQAGRRMSSLRRGRRRREIARRGKTDAALPTGRPVCATRSPNAELRHSRNGRFQTAPPRVTQRGRLPRDEPPPPAGRRRGSARRRVRTRAASPGTSSS
jgi:hypothetical protein